MTRLLTAKEVADYLGCHERTIRRMCGRRDIPAARIAGRWRIHPDDIPTTKPRHKPPAPRRVDYGPDSLTALARSMNHSDAS